MKHVLAIISLFFISSFIFPTTTHIQAQAPPQVVTLNPKADVYVRAGTYANDNFGTTTQLKTKLSSADFTRESFIRFDLSSLTINVQHASLRLTPVIVPTGGLTDEATLVSDNSWGETTITWNNKPASSTVLGSWEIVLGQATDVDVTTQVQEALAGDKKVSFRIYSTDWDVNVKYGSRESTDPPQLVISNNQPPQAIFTASPTSSSTAPLDVAFDATNASDPDGSIISYQWDFGDGQTATGVTATHTYNAGNHTATLTVTDDQGKTASNALGIVVGVANYYISETGSNTNDGSINAPWQSIQYAINQLGPGDTLNLRGGTYYQKSINIGIKGTVDQPITIRSYPGERATVDGGIPTLLDARNNPNTFWQLIDPAINLYRSAQPVPSSNVRGWLLDYQAQLVQYDNLDFLQTTNYSYVANGAPLYMGPGIYSDGSYIYIRLEPNPNDLVDPWGKPLDPPIQDTNPNNNRIAFYDGRILRFDYADYVNITDLNLYYADVAIDWFYGTNIIIDNVSFRHGRYGIITDYAKWSEIKNSEFDGGFPSWVYWGDVKTSATGNMARELESRAIRGQLFRMNIHHNTIHNVFDAFHIVSGSHNTSITYNYIYNTQDDGVTLNPGVDNMEIAYNIFRHAIGLAVTGTSGGPPKGNIYFHHNIMDDTRLKRIYRAGIPQDDDYRPWMHWGPFSSHNCSSGDCGAYWKVYNNLIIGRLNTIDARIGAYGRGMTPDAAPTAEKYVYNNIFYSIDANRIFAYDKESEGPKYDGNILWRDKSFNQTSGRDDYLLSSFGINKSFYSLADFQADPATTWEANGLEVSPDIDITTTLQYNYSEGYDYWWEAYRPRNPLIYTKGVDYAGLAWPDTDNIDYRGAHAPSTTQPTSSPTPTLPGDINNDGVVNILDYTLLSNAFGTSDPAADINSDGTVNILDYTILSNNFGNTV